MFHEHEVMFKSYLNLQSCETLLNLWGPATCLYFFICIFFYLADTELTGKNTNFPSQPDYIILFYS